MATLRFSLLQDELVYPFDPAVDTLIFDDPRISASEVFLSQSDHVSLSVWAGSEREQIGLDTTLDTLTSVNIRFGDGSVVKVGDNKPGTLKDHAGNKLFGGAGDDHLIGMGGNDTLIGGDGKDRFDGGQGNDRLSGGAGNDDLMLFADPGDDTLIGGAGRDTFDDTDGSNVFLGGAGNDVFTALADVSGDPNRATGGKGRDTYIVSIFPSINLPGPFPPVFPPNQFIVTDFNAGDSGDFLNISLALFISAIDGFYEGQDPFAGGFVQVVQSGDDALVRTDYDGAASGFSAMTALILRNTDAAAARAAVTGYILGGSGNDELIGDGSDQFLFAAAGNDTMDGGKGSDSMLGGSGADVYIVDDDGDTVNESSNDSELPGGLVIGPGGEGRAVAGDVLDSVLSAVSYSLENVQFVENIRLTGTVAREAVGNALDNGIKGNGINNLLKGLGGDDTLSGGAGADTALGGEGNDLIVWGAGDSVNGGAGIDTLKAGSLDLARLKNTRVLGIEQIDMSSGGANTLTLSRSDVLALSGETNTITVLGDSGDKVDISGSFTPGASSGGFLTCDLGDGALLKVETDVTVM